MRATVLREACVVCMWILTLGSSNNARISEGCAWLEWFFFENSHPYTHSRIVSKIGALHIKIDIILWWFKGGSVKNNIYIRIEFSVWHAPIPSLPPAKIELSLSTSYLPYLGIVCYSHMVQWITYLISLIMAVITCYDSLSRYSYLFQATMLRYSNLTEFVSVW